MIRSSSIKELASDIAKLSKTLSILAEEIASAHMQVHAEALVAMPEELKSQSQKLQTVEKKESAGEESSKNVDEEITIEQVRGVLAEKSQAGLTGKVKELLESFGANKLSAVKPENYAALMKAAVALK